MFRVKEINPSYDTFYNGTKREGWIYCTNELSFIEALLFILYQKKIRQSVLDYEVTPIMQLSLPEHKD
jgi:hypothetical protein